jgi:hypothetical protein
MTHLDQRLPGWLMDSANGERLASSVNIPQGWATADIYLWWANAGAGTGNIVIDLHVTDYDSGDLAKKLQIRPVVLKQVLSAGPQNQVAVSLLAQDVRVGSRNPLTSVMLDRVGWYPSDTVSNDVCFLGLELRLNQDTNVTLARDAGWCWFNEPRLIGYSGARKQLIASGVSRDGDAVITSFNTDTRDLTEFTLKQVLGIDDHNVPGVVVRPDGRLLAFYSRHGIVGDPIYWRRSTNPEDVSAWDSETTIPLGPTGQPTYPKPAYLGSRLYVFFRNENGSDKHQAFVYSDDDGATWTGPRKLFVGPTGHRPYVNFSAESGDRIDFITTDGHPREYTANNLYHFYMTATGVYRTDGTLISTIAGLPAGGLTSADVTKIYDNSTAGKAWGWDITRDAQGRPVVVFATFPTDSDHRYRYARWNGSAWSTIEMTAAGGAIGDGTEPQYSGGLSIARGATDTVYLSRPVAAQWEIEKWVTADGGTSWTTQAITSGSTWPQLRPTCTRSGTFAGCPDVAWESGPFTSFVNYDTRLVFHST